MINILKVRDRKMSKELKDLIDTIDSTNRAHSGLSKMINHLKEEVQRLTFTINEQKKVIRSQSAKLSSLEENNLPTDIQVLKEMIVNQRQDIVKKDKDIEILKKTLEDISLELEETKQFREENEELIYAQKSIVQLTEENEILNKKVQKLQQALNSREDDKEIDKDQQLIDAKKLLFQLTEENGIKSVKIESLKAEIKELKSDLEKISDINQELANDLNLNSQSNEDLTIQLKNLREKIRYLQEKLQIMKNQQEKLGEDSQKREGIENLKENLEMLKEENFKLKNIIETNTNIIQDLRTQNEVLSEELEDRKIKEQEFQLQNENNIKELTQKLLKIENANQQLNITINELREKEQKIQNMKRSEEDEDIKRSFLRNVNPDLFRLMYDRLSNDDQLKVKDILIQDLRNESREARTYAIKILSLIKDKEILKELKAMTFDQDWIVKLYLIKAFSRFDKDEVKDTLEELIKDPDPDVRESADKILTKFN